MPRRSRPYNGYTEKEARRKRQYNAYRKSTAGKLTDLLCDIIIAGIVLAWNVTVWIFKQVWMFLKTIFFCLYKMCNGYTKNLIKNKGVHSGHLKCPADKD